MAFKKRDGNYCPMCDTLFVDIKAHKCFDHNEAEAYRNTKSAVDGTNIKTDSVGISVEDEEALDRIYSKESVLYKEICNKAIEACFKEVSNRCPISQEAFEAIERLKK
jgi:hypothetical protein